MIMSIPNDNPEKTWETILNLDRSGVGEICRCWVALDRKVERLQNGLKKPEERAAALRVLLLLQDEELKKTLFAELVDLASSAHKDIGLCRTVIKSIRLDWVRSNIMAAMSSVLKKLADQPDWEEEAYQRYAELLAEIDQTLLLKHVEAAVVHANEGVREIGHDFDFHGQFAENS
jgi:hypothetical protein